MFSDGLLQKLEDRGFVSTETLKLLQMHLNDENISSYFDEGVTADTSGYGAF